MRVPAIGPRASRGGRRSGRRAFSWPGPPAVVQQPGREPRPVQYPQAFERVGSKGTSNIWPPSPAASTSLIHSAPAGRFVACPVSEASKVNKTALQGKASIQGAEVAWDPTAARRCRPGSRWRSAQGCSFARQRAIRKMREVRGRRPSPPAGASRGSFWSGGRTLVSKVDVVVGRSFALTAVHPCVAQPGAVRAKNNSHGCWT